MNQKLKPRSPVSPQKRDRTSVNQKRSPLCNYKEVRSRLNLLCEVWVFSLFRKEKAIPPFIAALRQADRIFFKFWDNEIGQYQLGNVAKVKEILLSHIMDFALSSCPLPLCLSRPDHLFDGGLRHGNLNYRSKVLNLSPVPNPPYD